MYPAAEVSLTVGGQTFLMPVALAPKLPYPEMLGQDVSTFLDLLPHPKLVTGLSPELTTPWSFHLMAWS